MSLIFQQNISAKFSETKCIELAFQKYNLELAEDLFQMRERDLVLKKTTFEFPGYDFSVSFPQGNYPVWEKPMPVKIKGGRESFSFSCSSQG